MAVPLPTEPIHFPAIYEAVIGSARWGALVEDYLRVARSPNTVRAYKLGLRQYCEVSGPRLSRELLGDYLTRLRAAEASPQRVNIALAAVRGLTKLAYARGLVSAECLAGIMLVKPDPIPHTSQAGSWLTAFELSQLIQTPDRNSVTGIRDRVILGLLGGCGLRRSEASTVRWDQYQDYFARKCLVNFIGKGRRKRTVPVPAWLVPDLQLWRSLQAEEYQRRKVEPISKEKLLAQQLVGHYKRPRQGDVFHRGFDDPTKILGGMGNQGVWWVVRTYAEKLGWDIAPHDLRRTLAQLMRLAGAELEQIMFTLGHSNLVITQHYLGSKMDFAMGKAAVDLIDLELQKKIDEDSE